MSTDFKNKKLIKEWIKIEHFGVFSSFEEFVEFYYAHGEKKCFRINTNEPWSKENFFFGEYSELLVYYKEEQPKKRIGQRFHSLTVLDVFWQEKDGKDTLFAKCKCDCGNETTKSVDAMVKGNARTCGCNIGRQKTTSAPKIIPIAKELIDELWDYEKNNVDPNVVSFDSTQKYWWKNKHGETFNLAPFVFVAPDTQTSFPEQAIFYHMKEYFNDAINKARYITQYGEVVEIDVFIPSLNIGIEYDGAFWHKDKLGTDEAKNKSLNDDGIYIIRIREEGLPPMHEFEGVIITRRDPTVPRSLIDCLNDLSKLLMKNYGVKIKYLPDSYYFTLKEFLANENEAPFIEETCLRIFWNRKKNGNFISEYIRLTSNIPYWFTCSLGKTFELTPNEIYTASKRYNAAFKNCNQNNCLHKCKQKARCCPFKLSKICKDWKKCCIPTEEGHQEHIPATNAKSKEIPSEKSLAEKNPEQNNELGTFEYNNQMRLLSHELKKQERYRLMGLCQYCGGNLLKKYLLFGDSFCVKCGKKKDY